MQLIFVTSAAGASAGTVCADHVVPPSTVLRIVLPSPAAQPVSVSMKKKLLSFAEPLNTGAQVLPPSVVFWIEPPALAKPVVSDRNQTSLGGAAGEAPVAAVPGTAVRCWNDWPPSSVRCTVP